MCFKYDCSCLFSCQKCTAANHGVPLFKQSQKDSAWDVKYVCFWQATSNLPKLSYYLSCRHRPRHSAISDSSPAAASGVCRGLFLLKAIFFLTIVTSGSLLGNAGFMCMVVSRLQSVICKEMRENGLNLIENLRQEHWRKQMCAVRHQTGRSAAL